MKREDCYYTLVSPSNEVEITRRVEGDDVKYFGETAECKPTEMSFYKESLIDVLDWALQPLNNLMLITPTSSDNDDSDAAFALQELFRYLLDIANQRMLRICSCVEQEVGKIELERTDCGMWGIMDGTILGVVITDKTQAAADDGTETMEQSEVMLRLKKVEEAVGRLSA